jgi:hypothetical protein
MKTIKIQQFTNPDKESVYSDRNKYKVVLGNDHTSYFTDKRKVSAFLNETNKYLNQVLIELNLYYTETFNLYRSSWLYFDNKKLSIIDKCANDNFNNINEAFKRIIIKSHTVNGNYLTWQFLNRIIEALIEVLELLHPFFTYRIHVDKIAKTKLFLSNLKQLKSDLIIYPDTEENLKKKLASLLG